MIVVDNSQCKKCGTCVEECPVGAIQIIEKKIKVGDGCSHCGLCIRICPVEALKKEREGVANILRKKLVDNDNPTAIIAALKLYGNDEDRIALNQQNIDLKTSGKIDYQKVTKIEGNLNKLNVDELKLLNELLEKIKE